MVGAGGMVKPFRGEFTVSSAPLSDPIPDGPLVVFLTIKGDAAKIIFNQMVNPKIEKNACGENGLTIKTVGDLLCSKMGATYYCNFGVGLSDGKLQHGYNC